MEQIIKKIKLLIGVCAMLLVIGITVGCNSGTEKSEDPASVEAPATEQSVSQDSLPPLDSSASARPEGVKTTTETQ